MNFGDGKSIDSSQKSREESAIKPRAEFTSKISLRRVIVFSQTEWGHFHLWKNHAVAQWKDWNGPKSIYTALSKFLDLQLSHL